MIPVIHSYQLVVDLRIASFPNSAYSLSSYFFSFVSKL
nr:MAG TPA: hypothetical protein [Microviridae sp.]